MTLTPDLIVKLFNEKLAGKGKIKKCPEFFLPMTIVQDFVTMRSYPKFDKIETWEEYFSMVEKSTFLTTQFTPSLAWLFKPENAFKVFSGQYDDKEQPSPNNPQIQAQAMASDLFDRIIRVGSHGLMDLLNELPEIDKKAIQNFGRASEILNCTEAQVLSLKKRLVNSFLKALS